jgi:hypothetical protein
MALHTPTHTPASHPSLSSVEQRSDDWIWVAVSTPASISIPVPRAGYTRAAKVGALVVPSAKP